MKVHDQATEVIKQRSIYLLDKHFIGLFVIFIRFNINDADRRNGFSHDSPYK